MFSSVCLWRRCWAVLEIVPQTSSSWDGVASGGAAHANSSRSIITPFSPPPPERSYISLESWVHIFWILFSVVAIVVVSLGARRGAPEGQTQKGMEDVRRKPVTPRILLALSAVWTYQKSKWVSSSSLSFYHPPPPLSPSPPLSLSLSLSLLPLAFPRLCQWQLHVIYVIFRVFLYTKDRYIRQVKTGICHGDGLIRSQRTLN